MAIRVGRWDCPFCGHIGNLGPETLCSACGRPRGSDVRFYLPEDAPEVTEEQELKQAKAGPDWNCDYCGSANSASKLSCNSCGNARDQADVSNGEKVYQINEVPRNGKQQPPPLKNIETTKPSKGKKRLFIGIISVIVFIILFGRPRVDELPITGFEWERAIEILQNCQITLEAWEVPSTATVTKSYRAIHHYKKVFDHYETKTRWIQAKVGEEKYLKGHRDLGNGHFEDVYSTRPVYERRQERYQAEIDRDVPVYQTKYVYTDYVWRIERIAKAGGPNHQPCWPQGAPSDPSWRDGAKTEAYYLVVTDKNDRNYKIKTNLKKWAEFHIGQKVRIKNLHSSKELMETRE